MKKYLWIFALCTAVILCLFGCEEVPNLSDMTGGAPL